MNKDTDRGRRKKKERRTNRWIDRQPQKRKGHNINKQKIKQTNNPKIK